MNVRPCRESSDYAKGLGATRAARYPASSVTRRRMLLRRCPGNRALRCRAFDKKLRAVRLSATRGDCVLRRALGSIPTTHRLEQQGTRYTCSNATRRRLRVATVRWRSIPTTRPLINKAVLFHSLAAPKRRLRVTTARLEIDRNRTSAWNSKGLALDELGAMRRRLPVTTVRWNQSQKRTR